MSERYFRLVLGAALIIILALDLSQAVYAYIAVLLFEAITNWRVPILVSRLRFGKDYMDAVNPCGGVKIKFEAERVLRLLVALFLVLSYVVFNDYLWFLPWFIGVMLALAGITNICPMVMALRWVGFK